VRCAGTGTNSGAKFRGSGKAPSRTADFDPLTIEVQRQMVATGNGFGLFLLFFGAVRMMCGVAGFRADDR
jgi:hypothetical protein